MLKVIHDLMAVCKHKQCNCDHGISRFFVTVFTPSHALFVTITLIFKWTLCKRCYQIVNNLYINLLERFIRLFIVLYHFKCSNEIFHYLKPSHLNNNSSMITIRTGEKSIMLYSHSTCPKTMTMI